MESGHYFIKANGNDDWDVAYYDSEEGVWFWNGERSDCVKMSIDKISPVKLEIPYEIKSGYQKDYGDKTAVLFKGASVGCSTETTPLVTLKGHSLIEDEVDLSVVRDSILAIREVCRKNKLNFESALYKLKPI